MTDNPFALLGLAPGAGPDELRAKFRELALRHHPDRGGDPAAMAAVLDAYREAVALSAAEATDTGRERGQGRRVVRGTRRLRADRDIASFTVSVLPVEAFEALRLVVVSLGDLVDEDPPYAIEFMVRIDTLLWCRCDLVPDAGSTTVSVAVVPAADEPLLRVEQMRDVLVAELNQLDW